MTNPGFRILAALLSVSVCMAQGHAADGVAPTQVIVNAVPLSAGTLRALQRMYPVPIQPGRYWYDRVSGAYGSVESRDLRGTTLARSDALCVSRKHVVTLRPGG